MDLTQEPQPQTFKSEKERIRFRKQLEKRIAAELDLEGKRQCNKCGKIKPHSHMKKDSKRPFGVQKICKDCDNFVWPKTAKWKAIDKERRKQIREANAQIADAVNNYFPPSDGFRICEFCGCNTNAKLRLCCNRGRYQDMQKNAPLDTPTDTPAMDTPDGTVPQPPPPPPVYPKNEPTSDETKMVEWWDKFFADSRKGPQPFVPPQPMVKIDESELPIGLLPYATKEKAVMRTVNPMAEADMKKVVRSALESPVQKALRQKMKDDGFSQKMIDGAVKLLPQILHELKSLDETI
jgi:hypothetical protein